MPYQYTVVDEKAFPYGIDARSAENQIREGFIRDLVNADIIEGRIRKRKGFFSYAGNVPVRVTSLRYENPNKIYFTLDSSIDLSRVSSTPLIAYGRSNLSATTNPFPSSGGLRYYPSWETSLRKVFLANTTGSISSLQVEHNISTTNMFVGLALSTGSGTNLSGELISATDIVINNSTYDVTVDYTNGTNSAKNVFLYYLDQSPVAGSVYVQPGSLSSGNNTFTIPAATHNLSNYLITPQVYVRPTGGNWVQTTPDLFEIDTSNGGVEVQLNNINTAVYNEYKIILSIVGSTQAVNVSLNVGTNTITIPDIQSPFLFPALYTRSGNILSLVQPDVISFDDDTKLLSISYTNNSGALSGAFYYTYGNIRTNEISVTESGSPNLTTGTDTSPQLTLWGLDHADIYGSGKQVNRRGWVNHIDSYRSPSTTHLVAGLGGNFFAALGRGEMPSLLQPSIPTYYARLQGRLSSLTDIGPAFCDNSTPVARTRGYASFSSGGTNWATITKIQHQSGQTVRYYLSMPGLAITGGSTLADIISTTSGLEDYLTVKNMSHSKHNGTFKVVNVSTLVGDNQYIDVINSAITTSDYDDDGTRGLGGIFTDHLTFTSTNEFVEGDLLLSSSWGNETELVIKSTSALTSVVQNVYSYRELSSGLLITGQRTSDVIPLRTAANSPSTEYVVKGDILLTPAVPYPVQIVSIDTVNNKVTVDSPLSFYDDAANSIPFTIFKRWIPREMPLKDNGDNLINDKIPFYFTNDGYDNQSFLRSAMVQNNMYLTNGRDEVYKYDGNSIYRAGIIPWQPGLFSTVEATTAGIALAPAVANDGGGGAVIDLLGSRIKIDKTQAAFFSDGDTVLITDGTLSPVARYYVTIASRELEDTGNHYLFSFKEPLPFTTLGSGATVTMSKVYQARYYFRLNIRDENGVTISSAVTGAGDFYNRISPTDTAPNQQKVHIRLVGLPAWDNYDYNNKNIELEIYRTKWASSEISVPTFYKVSTKTMPYVGLDGYIDFVDSYNNDTLTDDTSDAIAGVLSPSVTPAGWDEPMRAKYVTSAGNRLVLANIKDWPTLSVSYLTATSLINTDFNGQKFLFRKDSSDTATDTNMVDRVTYELRSSGSATVGTITAGSPTGFTFTCNFSARTPVVGDWVYLYFTNSLSHPLTCSGWWQVASVSGSSGAYTIGINTATSVVVPIIASHPMQVLFSTAAYDVPVNIATDQNMGMFNGNSLLTLAPSTTILRRIGMAINSTMRMVDLSVHNQSAFIPWLVARSESDTLGNLIVKQPRVEDTLPSVTISGGLTSNTYVNGSKVTASTPINAAITAYPSRLLVSYNNYPEIFDSPFVTDDNDSVSTIDINSSDGQEITGIIPFFGESAFGAALQGGVIVVFKQNSIYLVNLDYKREGRNPVERLETQGIGCTAPYSIASTRDGIAFANDSGIYVLRRTQRVEYLGKYMERKWQKEVDTSYLDIMQGHHYNVGRQYKLSVPMIENSTSSYAENGEVYVYNHTNETNTELGGWARYTNHPATGWTNLFDDAFYASVNGSILRVNNQGLPQDYRDGSDAIEMVFQGRANDFGQAGIRKIVSHVIVNYRSGGVSDNTTVETAPDLMRQYDTTTPFTVVNIPPDNGFSSLAGQDVTAIRHSIYNRRCIYITVKIINNGLNEDMEVAGMSFVVAGLNSKGIKQAAVTKE